MRKMNKMELEISQKSLKISFAFVMCALAIYAVYGLVTETTQIPLMILIIQNLSYLLSKTFYDKKYGVNHNKK